MLSQGIIIGYIKTKINKTKKRKTRFFGLSKTRVILLKL